MKKIAKILFGMITVFILCVTSLNFSEASIKQDQKNAVKKYYALMKNGSGDYKIVDINGDKVKDLLWIDTSTSQKQKFLYIVPKAFTYYIVLYL